MSDLYREIINTMCALTVVLDAEGRVVLFNPACERISGYRFDEIKGRPLWDFVLPPENAGSARAAFAELAAGQFPNRHENRWLSKSGGGHLIEWSNSAVVDDTGRVVNVICTGIDVTAQRATAETLHAAQLHKKSLLDSMVDAAWQKDINGIYLEVNPMFAKRNRQDISNIIGKNDFELFGPKIAHRRLISDREVRRTGQTVRYERKYTIDGANHWFETIKAPVLNKAGLVIGITGISRDITELRSTAQALYEREYLLSESQRVARIGSWSVDIASDNAAWSDETYRIYGVSPDSFVPTVQTLLDLVHPGERPALQAWIRACAAGEKPADLEFRTIRANGEIRTLRGRGALLPGTVNTPPRMIGTIQDVTELKHAEQRLHETLQMQHALLNSIPDAAWLRNVDGKYVALNRTYAERWNVKPSQLIGGDAIDFMSAAIAQDTMAEDREIVRTRKPLHHEKHRVICGKEYWLDIIKTPVVNETGNVIGIAGVSRDITERKLAEAERIMRDTALRAALVKEVHHRIKNNLQGVITLIEQLSSQPLQNNELTAAVISRVNAIASMHGLYGAIGTHDLNLDHIMSALVSSLKILYPSLHVQLAVSGNATSTQIVESEVVPLALVINELIMNAIKHSNLTPDRAAAEILLEIKADAARITICSAAGRLPAHFDFVSGRGLGTGLSLVKSMLPATGAELRIENANEDGVQTELILRPPVIRASDGLPAGTH